MVGVHEYRTEAEQKKYQSNESYFTKIGRLIENYKLNK